MTQHIDLSEQASLFRHRVVYDALARISCNINLCDNITDVIACLNNDVKYLFDHIALRFCLTGPDQYLRTLCIGQKTVQQPCEWGDAQAHTLFDIEERVAKTGLPEAYHSNELIRTCTGAYFKEALLSTIDTLWVRPFTFQDGFTITASIFSGGDKRFRSTDIPVLKILCTAFFAKIRSLKLYEEATATKNQLQDALSVLRLKNDQISKLVEEQEAIIQERTLQLQHRNAKLSEIAFFNSHSIREPLTRILGLVQLTRSAPVPMLTEEIMPRLYKSSADLDQAIRDAIHFLEQDGLGDHSQ